MFAIQEIKPLDRKQFMELKTMIGLELALAVVTLKFSYDLVAKKTVTEFLLDRDIGPE